MDYIDEDVQSEEIEIIIVNGVRYEEYICQKFE